MKAIFILALAGGTSLAAFFFGVKGLRLSGSRLGAAIGKTFEAVGTTFVFLAINLAVAVIIVLTVRGLTGTHVSVYVTDDSVWIGLSLLQGLTFQWWRELSGKPRS
jgi:hypothetical protein